MTDQERMFLFTSTGFESVRNHLIVKMQTRAKWILLGRGFAATSLQRQNPGKRRIPDWHEERDVCNLAAKEIFQEWLREGIEEVELAAS